MGIRKKHTDKISLRSASIVLTSALFLNMVASTVVVNLPAGMAPEQKTGQQQLQTSSPTQKSDTDSEDVSKAFASMYVPFVENKGQIENEVAYYASVQSGVTYVKKNGDLVYKFNFPENKQIAFREIPVSSQQLMPQGENPTKTSINYISQNDKSDWEWQRDLPNFKTINLGEAFKNIKVELKARGNEIEKILTVNPGGNVSDIAFRFEGVKNLERNAEGQLIIHTEAGDTNMSKPVAFQQIGSEKKNVEVAYRTIDNSGYGFTVGEYDKALPLIIDPLIGSTFLGGATQPAEDITPEDIATAITFGPAPDYDIYVTGNTVTPDFPTENDYGTSYDTRLAINADSNRTRDVFIARFSSDLTNLKAATYIGNDFPDNAIDIEYYAGGSGVNEGIYITGHSGPNYQQFPSWPINNIYGTSYRDTAATSDEFWITQFDLTLQTIYASTLGPAGDIVINSNGLYVNRYYDPTYDAGICLFDGTHCIGRYYSGMTRWNPNLTGIIDEYQYQDFITNHNDLGQITADSAGNIYSCGNHMMSQAERDISVSNIKVIKFDSALTSYTSSALIGGNSYDYCLDIDIDSNSNIYISGNTSSTDFTTTNIYGTSYQTVNKGINEDYMFENFLAKLDSSLNILASTYFGSTGNEGQMGYSGYLTIDLNGNPYLYATPGSDIGMPSLSWAYDTSYQYYCVYIARFNSSLTAVEAFTYIGGQASTLTYADIKTLPDSGDLVGIAHQAYSSFPTTPGAYDRTVGFPDSVVFRITEDLASLPQAVTLSAVGGNSAVNLSWSEPVGGASGYIVEYGTVASGLFENTCSTTSCTDATPGATVTGLTNGTPYQFRVRTINPYYESENSNTATATPTGVPTPPLNLAAVSGASSADLTWEVPLDDGGSAITSYTVRYGLVGSCYPDISVTNCSTVSSATTSRTVTGLAYSSEYIYAVLANNANGASLPSNTATSTTAVPPDPPTNLTATGGNQTADLSWVAPLNNGGMPITGYTIIYGPNGICDPTTSPYTNCSGISSATTSVTIGSLLYNVQYIFVAYAENIPGTSGPSNTATTTPSCASTNYSYDILFNSNRTTIEINRMDMDGSIITTLQSDLQILLNESISPDGTKIIAHDEQNIYIMDADGSNLQNLTNNTGYGLTWGGSFTPDGTKIIFFSSMDDLDGTDDEIYIINTDGSSLINLTNNAVADYHPKFSLDGTRIIFGSWRDGNNEIYIMNADGTNQTNLTNNVGDDENHQFTPDGTKIIFQSYRDGNWEIYSMNADGTNQINLTNNSGDDYMPTVSPDGNNIVFGSNRDGNSEVYIMNIDGSGPQNLTNNVADDVYGGHRPGVFSPDSNKIAFQSYRDGNWEIYTVDKDGTDMTRLTNNTYFDFDPLFDTIGQPQGNSQSFCASQTIAASILSFTGIPDSFSFPDINSSGVAQNVYNNGEAMQPDPNDMLSVYDTRESGGFEVQIQASGEFSNGTETIPLSGLYVATSIYSPASAPPPATDTAVDCPATDCGVIYSTSITERGITAPLDSQGNSLESTSTFTSNLGSGPLVLMQAGLPDTSGRNGSVYQYVSFRLTIPALQAEGNYAVVLTYTLIDYTT